MTWLRTILVALVVVLGLRWVERNTMSLFDPRAVPHEITPRGDLAEDEKSTIELFKKCSPSVVHITTATLRRNPFDTRVAEVPQGTGSGFIWSEDGYIVTNFHVVNGGKAFHVSLSDHTNWTAELVGVAPDKDLAVLKIAAPEVRLQPLAIGESGNLVVGQKVFAIGNPFGLDQTLTSGIISGLGREIESLTGRPIQGVVQTDAAINPGNSGGPLLDSAGRLIGVNTAIAGTSGSSSGVGFAVPVDTVNRIVPQLIRTGKSDRVGLGIRIAEDQALQRLGLEGVLVTGVVEDGAAAKAGLRPTVVDEESGDVELGDIITSVNQRPIRNARDLYRALDAHQPGDTIQIEVQRDKATVPVAITLQAL